MNNFSKLSLYDFLAMLIPGFIILWFCNFLGIDIYDGVNEIIIAILSYVTGLCYHKLIEVIVTIAHLRRSKCMQEKAWKQFYNKVGIERDHPENIDREFVLSYYRIAKAGCLMNIPILEAQETFLRNSILLLLFSIPYVVCHYQNHYDLCCICTFLILLLVGGIFAWFCIAKKIYYLVWEGDYYLKELNDEKTSD